MIPITVSVKILAHNVPVTKIFSGKRIGVYNVHISPAVNFFFFAITNNVSYS